ncbi:MAG: DDE-type integrase/transposase/recombinase [Roseobacter sp.]
MSADTANSLDSVIFGSGRIVAKIAAKSFWIWRAVDQNAIVLVEILQPRWNKKTAKRPRYRLMKRHDIATKRSVTDKLRSYGAAKRVISPNIGLTKAVSGASRFLN